MRCSSIAYKFEYKNFKKVIQLIYEVRRQNKSTRLGTGADVTQFLRLYNYRCILSQLEIELAITYMRHQSQLLSSFLFYF